MKKVDITKSDEFIYYLNSLRAKHQKFSIGIEETANELNISQITLRRRVKKCENVPKFYQANDHAKIEFKIFDVAMYLASKKSNETSY